MSVNDSEIRSHPEELLEAYALDALDDDEASLVESHLEVCPHCTQVLDRLQRSAAMLGQAVEQRQPPPYLLSQIMDSLLPAEPVPAANSDSPPSTRSKISPAAWALPLAASVVIALFSISMFMNLHISSRMDRLEQENSTVTARLDESEVQARRLEQENSVLTARLNRAMVEENQLSDSVQQIQTVSYLTAHPDTEQLLLEPPGGAGNSQGVLLVPEGGHSAVLMVFNLEQPPPFQAYHVWLVKDGSRVPMGQIRVNSNGWGTLTLRPPEPLFQFHWVNLTIEEEPEEKMVLWSRIPPEGSGR